MAGYLLFCFLNNFRELRILTTLYLAKNDHQWVTFISHVREHAIHETLMRPRSCVRFKCSGSGQDSNSGDSGMKLRTSSGKLVEFGSTTVSALLVTDEKVCPKVCT